MIFSQIDRQIDRWIDGQMDRWIDRQIDQTDKTDRRQMDRQMIDR